MEAYPTGWRRILGTEVDFEKAFGALQGYEHFHSETLRARVRMLQLRTEEAREHLRRAGALYQDQKSLPDAERLHFFLRLTAMDTAVAAEAMDPGEAAESTTDKEVLAFLDLEEPCSRAFDAIRIRQIGYYKILRGDFAVALEAFEGLLEGASEALQEDHVAAYCGAAAAFRELGLDAEAGRHFENAAIAVGLVRSTVKAGFYAVRLHTILTHWGRPEDAREWLDRIHRLPCPPESKRCFLRWAEVLTSASSAMKRIVIC